MCALLDLCIITSKDSDIRRAGWLDEHRLGRWECAGWKLRRGDLLNIGWENESLQNAGERMGVHQILGMASIVGRYQEKILERIRQLTLECLMSHLVRGWMFHLREANLSGFAELAAQHWCDCLRAFPE